MKSSLVEIPHPFPQDLAGQHTSEQLVEHAVEVPDLSVVQVPPAAPCGGEESSSAEAGWLRGPFYSVGAPLDVQRPLDVVAGPGPGGAQLPGLPPGHKVLLRHLVAQPRLTGLQGTLEVFVPATGRWSA